MLYPTDNIRRLFERSKDQIDLYLGKDTKVGEASAGFSSVQLTPRSVILRKMDPMHVAFHSASLELFVDGSAKFFLPFPHFDLLSRGYLTTDIRSSEARESLQKFVEHSSLRSTADITSITSTHFFNIGQLLSDVYVYLNFYIDWLGSDVSLVPEFKSALSLKNAWRCVPFIDMDEWGRHVDLFGLPILLSQTISVPDEPGKGYVIDVQDDVYNLWGSLASNIGMACGLTVNLTSEAILGSMLNIQSIPLDWKKDWDQA